MQDPRTTIPRTHYFVAARGFSGQGYLRLGGRAPTAGRLGLNADLQKSSIPSRHQPSNIFVARVLAHCSSALPSNPPDTMASESETPKREPTPTGANLPSSIPPKRAPDEDHLPNVPSPLNPDVRTTPKPQQQQQQAPPPPTEEMAPASTRDKPARAKKETLKKREAKGALGGGAGGGGAGGGAAGAAAGGVGGAGGADSSRATPDPRQREPPPGEASPMRYKLAPPKASDFEPSRGPVLTHHHDVAALDGSAIEFFEASDQ